MDIDKKRMEELENAEKVLKNRYKYQNNYQKNNYDRIVLALPKGAKNDLETIAKKRGFKSVTEYIKSLIEKDKQL